MDCICCNSSNFDVYSEKSYLELQINKCKNCGLYVTGNSEERIKDIIQYYYKKEFWDIVGSELSLTSNFTDVNSQGKRRQWVSQYAYCKPYLQNKKRFLDVGAGAGQTIFWFEELDFDVMGIEPDLRNVELINGKLKNGKCLQGFIEEFNTNEKFDIIWISHVFEHLIKPDIVLKKFKKNINPNGIVFIEVPNCGNKEILDLSIHKNPSTYHFTKDTISNIAKRSGYKVLRCDVFKSPTLFEGVIQRISRKFRANGIYPFYPKIISNDNNGTDIRIILSS